MSNEQEMREAFEGWAGVYGLYLGLHELNNGDYYRVETQSAWHAWQAATLAAEARIRELEADARRYSKLREIVSKGDLVGTDDRDEFDHWVDTMVRADAAITEHKENQ